MNESTDYKPAPLPADEAQRLEELELFKILDTPAEADFDGLTELARAICDTPIALISLLDEKRQWFKSCIGLDVTETPREVAFCGFAILQGALYEINDTHETPHLANNPLVIGPPFIRFYAGMPLKSANGFALGTLCVIDTKPRVLNDIQRHTLEVLAGQIVQLLELRQSRNNYQRLAGRFSNLTNRVPGALFELEYNVGRLWLPFISASMPSLSGIAKSTLRDDPGYLLTKMSRSDRHLLVRSLIASCRALTLMQVCVQVTLEGEAFWFYIEAMPERFGSGVKWYGILSDVTGQRQGHVAVEAERAMYQRIMGAASAGVVACNAQGELTVFNETALQWHGADIRSLPPEQWSEYYDLFEADGQTPLALERIPLIRALNGESVRGAPMVIARKGYPLRHVSANADPIVSMDGTPLGAVAIMHDVTARVVSEHALKASRKQFNQAFSTAPIAMALTDFDGHIIEANAAFPALFGYHSETWRTRAFKELMHPDDWAKAKAMGRELLAQTKTMFYQLEGRFRGADGRGLWGDMRCAIIPESDGTPRQFIVQIMDTSERHRLAELKSEFISSVSHELRTPLTSINASLGMLSAGVLGVLPEKAIEMVKVAHDSSFKLQSLVESLLDMERITSGHMTFEFEELDVETLLERQVERHRELADKAGITFRVSCARRALIRVDAKRIDQVFACFIDNAIRFSPTGSVVELVGERLDGDVRLSVIDQGVGIDNEFKAYVFQRFVQSDGSTTRRHNGLGIGLALSKELTEGMGGRIGFSSSKGEGSCFYMLFPLSTLD
ncbi:PAS domain S-box protein [Larsenimonas salina]|uniref:PAS domain S-box protein n=1 Tax=Larsenimonas salina TaxID=1295565 RepID=UPI002073C4A6|nr:PAS domain S-box protein [Larsenimonas salina]MCM5704982.1 PAS domain S-box protein [Larsenimonas salina]